MKSIINTMPLGTAFQKPAKASPDQLLAFIRHIAFGSQTPAACWFQLRLLASRSQLQAETNRLLFMMINLCWSSLGLFYIWITTLILCTSIILTYMSVGRKHLYCILLLLYVRYKLRGFFFELLTYFFSKYKSLRWKFWMMQFLKPLFLFS
jgi:hypothetical protein